ncbi:MAG: DUF2057 family protein [Hahellaceae bacterium]|nr:DUF2057 family protein [Hahellaceae bacterium]
MFRPLIFAIIPFLSASSSIALADDTHVNPLAIVTFPETVKVLEVDGEARGILSGLFSGKTHRLELIEGPHTLLAEYSQFWQLNAEDHDIISSEPVRLQFSLEANKQYRLIHPEAKSYAASQALAMHPQITIIDADGNLLPSLNHPAEDRDHPANAYDNPVSSPRYIEKHLEKQSTFESVRALWQQADPGERAAIKAWINLQTP